MFETESSLVLFQACRCGCLAVAVAVAVAVAAVLAVAAGLSSLDGTCLHRALVLLEWASVARSFADGWKRTTFGNPPPYADGREMKELLGTLSYADR